MGRRPGPKISTGSQGVGVYNPRFGVLGQQGGRPKKGTVVLASLSAPSPHQRRRVTVRLLPSGPRPMSVMNTR